MYFSLLLPDGHYDTIRQKARQEAGEPVNNWWLKEAAMRTFIEAALTPSTAAQHKGARFATKVGILA